VPIAVGAVFANGPYDGFEALKQFGKFVGLRTKTKKGDAAELRWLLNDSKKKFGVFGNGGIYRNPKIEIRYLVGTTYSRDGRTITYSEDLIDEALSDIARHNGLATPSGVIEYMLSR
jgi:hypothetical protein